MNAIIDLFGNDTALNDYLVYKFVCRNKYVSEKLHKILLLIRSEFNKNP